MDRISNPLCCPGRSHGFQQCRIDSENCIDYHYPYISNNIPSYCLFTAHVQIKKLQQIEINNMRTKAREIIADPDFVAYCGLYCGACRSFLSSKCPGCAENKKASWCKIRQCCIENNLKSCADCRIIEHTRCSKYNTFISRIFGYIFNSDRGACIDLIREIGYEEYSLQMALNKRQTIRRK